MDKNPHHDKSQKGTENQKIIKELIKNLGNSDGVIRERARRKLVSIGPSAIDYLAELVYTKNEMLRWEAVKTLSEIVNPVAIPLLIDALEDDKSSIRWLAAEGLIMLGREAVKPLLVISFMICEIFCPSWTLVSFCVFLKAVRLSISSSWLLVTYLPVLKHRKTFKQTRIENECRVIKNPATDCTK
ncbi:MAG: HEAT repeat domain-containing protein [Calditrichia bacterium]